MARPKMVSISVFENASSDYQKLKNGNVALKLMAIMACKDHTSEVVSKIFKFSQRHFLKILHDYKEHGLEGLMNQPRGHNASKLSKEQLEEIKQWILDSTTQDKQHIHWTLEKLKSEIEKKYNVTISKVAIWNHLHALGLSVRVPRPSHVKGDKAKQEDF